MRLTHALIRILMAALAMALAFQAWAQAPAVPDMTARQVSPSAWYVQGVSALGSPANQNFISNAGFVITPAGVVVIDALGSPALAQRLLAEIRKHTDQPVTHVILTHYHADHIYGLQTFKAAGAKVLAHRTRPPLPQFGHGAPAARSIAQGPGALDRREHPAGAGRRVVGRRHRAGGGRRAPADQARRPGAHAGGRGGLPAAGKGAVRR